MIKRIVDYTGHQCIGSTCCCIAQPEAYGLVRWVEVVTQKCDLCGSTARDHTENNCQLNRLKKEKEEGGE